MNTNIMNGVTQRPALSQIFLIAQQELQASFASKRGLFVTGVFVVVWSWLLFYPIRIAAEAITNPENSSLSFTVLGWLGLETINDWAMAEFAVYWAVALFIFPAFSLLMSADQMISERNRGGLRFLTLRCGRGQIFFGRFIGHLLIQACLLAVTLVITLGLLIFNNAPFWFDGLLLLPLLFLNLIIVVSPFVALMSLLSVVMKSVRMATLIAIIILVLASMIINAIASELPFIAVLDYLIPGMQLFKMAQSSASDAVLFLWLPVFQSVCFLGLGYGLFKRQTI